VLGVADDSALPDVPAVPDVPEDGPAAGVPEGAEPDVDGIVCVGPAVIAGDGADFDSLVVCVDEVAGVLAVSSFCLHAAIEKTIARKMKYFTANSCRYRYQASQNPSEKSDFYKLRQRGKN
jgi:hypothetical protein